VYTCVIEVYIYIYRSLNKLTQVNRWENNLLFRRQLRVRPIYQTH